MIHVSYIPSSVAEKCEVMGEEAASSVWSSLAGVWRRRQGAAERRWRFVLAVLSKESRNLEETSVTNYSSGHLLQLCPTLY